MRSQNNKQGFPFRIFKIKEIRSITAIFMAISLLNLTFSCSYYGVKKVKSSPETMAEHIQSFNEQSKYIILHDNDVSWHISNVTINEEDLTLSGIIRPLDPTHVNDNFKKDKTSFRYRKKKSDPLNEAHFFISKSLELNVGDTVRIPFKDIKKITVNKRDTGREVMSYIGGSLGIAIVVAAIALAATSCPFVYVKQGGTYEFVGELYPGIITPNLQKDDYVKLPLADPRVTDYNIQITNELKEIQYTDLARLIVVDHNKNREVLLDKNGKAHTFQKILGPKNVILNGVMENTEPALEKDNNFYGFDTYSNDMDLTRNVRLEFENPEYMNCGKIYLTLKNSIWLDYAYGQFNAQFGGYFNKFQSDIQDEPAEKSLKWTSDQHIPLSVYIMKNNEWILLDEISSVGAMAYRDIVIPFDEEGIQGDDLQIKLETGFMFWEVDYVGVDYTQNENVMISYVNPMEAIDESGNDVTQLLTNTDKKYLVQPEIGNHVEALYKLDDLKEGLDRTVFLMNRGYYNYIRDYSGMPDIQLLKSFQEEESFTKFSIQKYNEIIEAETSYFSNLDQ